jgi:hypothetical protein
MNRVLGALFSLVDLSNNSFCLLRETGHGHDRPYRRVCWTPKGFTRLHFGAVYDVLQSICNGKHGSLINNFSSVPDNLPVAVQNATFELSVPMCLVSLCIYVYEMAASEYLACQGCRGRRMHMAGPTAERHI